MGSIYNSKYKSGSMITMSKRLNIIKGYKDDTPGPGSYLHFSEFGMWVPKNYKKLNNKKGVNSPSNSIKDYFKKRVIRRVLSEDKSLKRDRIISATT